MKDYRRMLYRLDLATSFRSVDALLLHFMDETPLDGFIEIRVHSVYSDSDLPVNSCPTPSARLSFLRDPLTGMVVADRLFKPAQSSHEKNPSTLYKQLYSVAKTYPERTLLLDAFSPIVQPLLTGNRSTLIFEYRAFLKRPDPTSVGALDEFEIVTRQVPHKLMVGYIGRSERGALAAYQLDDNVARTTFLDMNPMAFQPTPAGKDLGRECVIA